MIFCKEFFCGYVCVRGVSKIINLCVAGVWWNFIYLDLFVWLILSGDGVWKFLVAICCVLCRCLCSFFCSLWRRWTYKYMLNKIYLAVTRMDFFWSRWFLYWYDFLSNLLYNCACVWWGFYADGFLCYKFVKNINIIYYLIIYNNL